MRKDLIRGAYKALGGPATVYDAMMTCSTPLGVAMSWAVWLIGPQGNATRDGYSVGSCCSAKQCSKAHSKCWLKRSAASLLSGASASSMSKAW